VYEDDRDGDLLVPGPTGWSRRRFLGSSAVALGALAGGGVIAGCSSSSSPSTASTAAAGPPRKGGTLRFGGQGGATTDTLDAHNPLTNTDNARVPMLYDPLVRLNNQARTELVLATSITPNNATATQWTIKIQPNVVTHAGKPFTSADVLYSFQRMVDNKFPGAIALGPVDLKNSKAVDPTTVLLAFSSPYSILVDALSLYFVNMVPIGYDPKHPVGTGPFKYESFTPGVQSTFTRNENYWQSGKPYLDAIVTTNIADETSQVNGLESGQLDVINFLSATSVAALRGGTYKVNISKTGSWGPFTMRVDTKPYSDVRVRQAFRLIIDRPQMLKQVFGGYGTVGNDVIGIIDQLYNTSLPQRHQDIGQAKSLLSQAGYSNLTVQLITTLNGPGQIPAAQVFASQAKAAGVNVNIVQQSATQYFAQSYLKVPFSQDYWPTQPYLVAAAQALTGKTAPFNATFQNDPEYNSLYNQAISTTDPTKQKSIAQQMMQIEYERGGYMIPYFFPTIDASTNKVQGIEPSETGLSPGGFDWKNFWLSA
jgi:peptide/nickel transport system substrate-binding protein